MIRYCSKLRTPATARAGFTLVEMLVVVGIVILITALLLPAVMRARRAGKQAVCMNNLREIGRMLINYAETNDDYVPLGTSIRAGNKPENQWRGDWNDFAVVNGEPMSAAGPLILNGMIYQDNAKLLYCPTDAREDLNIDLRRRFFPAKGERVVHGTIKISYSSRPEKKIWQWGQLNPYPLIMPKLSDYAMKAIMAEAPDRPPYNHGTPGDPLVHVLYQDGAVRLAKVAGVKNIKPEVWFEFVQLPDQSDRENKTAMSAWEMLDKQ